MTEPIQTYPCPGCRKLIRWDTGNRFRPFCSERCRLLDFGAWAKEQHRIEGEEAPLSDDGMPEDRTREPE